MEKTKSGIVTDIFLGAIMLTGAIYLYYHFMLNGSNKIDLPVFGNQPVSPGNTAIPEIGAPETPVIIMQVNEVEEEPCMFPGEMLVDYSITDMRPDYGYMQ